MRNDVVIIRGGGDIATGVIQKLYRSGCKVLVLEVNKPLAIRRNVALSDAIYDGKSVVEDVKAVLTESIKEVNDAWDSGAVPIIVDPQGDYIDIVKPTIVVDAILAKKNLGTNQLMAPITIALGPGFNAGKDVDVVVETMRGHNLGRLIFSGYAHKNTGVPGDIGGYTLERVIHSPKAGVISNKKVIGDVVHPGETIAVVDNEEVKTKISGILRGIIRDGLIVTKGLKIADVDPRLTEIDNCHTISDKARNIGGAVLEAILYMKNKIAAGGDNNG